MFWMTLLTGILKRPWIIVLIVMTLAMAAQWVKITSLKSDIVKLDSKIVLIEKNFNTCKSNEDTLNGAITSCNFETDKFIQNIDLLATQIQQEKDRVVYWRDKYNNKVCYNPVTDTVTVSPDDRRILNDEKNVDAINRINNIFKP